MKWHAVKSNEANGAIRGTNTPNKMESTIYELKRNGTGNKNLHSKSTNEEKADTIIFKLLFTAT